MKISKLVKATLQPFGSIHILPLQTRIAQVVIIMIAILSFTHEVDADWKYTNWDMTQDDVIKASEGTALKIESPQKMKSGLVKAVTYIYITEPFLFDVSFLFLPSNDLLDRIVLKLRNNNEGTKLYTKLVKVYGEPYENEVQEITGGESHKAKWKDLKNNNIVSYFNVKNIYRVEYRPIKRHTPEL